MNLTEKSICWLWRKSLQGSAEPCREVLLLVLRKSYKVQLNLGEKSSVFPIPL